ncbi:MAG: hypothetical protein OXK75_00615 [Gammaproteobacteria bacterium]|nr:hypothetical protein [Gammaproteobacteria bacterium]
MPFWLLHQDHQLQLSQILRDEPSLGGRLFQILGFERELSLVALDTYYWGS